MEPHQLVTLFDLLKDLTTVMATLAEETRALRKAHTAVRHQMERIQEAVRAPAGRPPPGARPAPWRRYGHATAGSLTRARSARRPASMPSCSPPRPRAAAVATCIGTTTRSTGDAASVPAPGSWRASSPRRTHDLSRPGPACQAHRRRLRPVCAPTAPVRCSPVESLAERRRAPVCHCVIPRPPGTLAASPPVKPVVRSVTAAYRTLFYPSFLSCTITVSGHPEAGGLSH